MRQRYAEGLATRDELLAAEMGSYHDAGTCTFYGTANSNQMLMELMGLHVPGAAFVAPNTPLRHALTVAATQRVAQTTALGANYLPFVEVIDERSFVNAIVGLMATGGSTNHVIHLVAMARAFGLTITWDDMADISRVTPLLARVYPNGEADVNQFHAAGGMAFVVRELINAGLAHESAMTVWGPGLSAYAKDPFLVDSKLVWRDAPEKSHDEKILRPASNPFSADGGLKLLRGNLGRSVIKTSAVRSRSYWDITAPARVFESQEALAAALKAGIEGDFIAVVRGQGPRANGMPELHKLIPAHVGLVSQGPARGHRHRRAHVRRLRQGALGDSPHARSGGRWADLAAARWRHHPARCPRGRARSAGRCRHAAVARAGEARGASTRPTAWAASCSRGCARARRRRTRARRSCKRRLSTSLEQTPGFGVATPGSPSDGAYATVPRSRAPIS